MLLLAAAAGALASALFGGTKPVPADAVYVCPMHPAVRARAPGRCPVCGMALVAAPSAPSDTAAAGDALGPADLLTVRPHLFPLPIRAPAWMAADGTVVALLYRDEADGLSREAPATFTAAPPLSAAVPVRLAGAGAPPVRDGETVEVTFRATTAAGKPGEGGPEVGWVSVDVPSRPVLTVDENLVFTAGDARYVLVPSGDGRGGVQPRAVTLGRVINGRAVVVAGLVEGDHVVRRRAFFLDADLRAREAGLGAPP